MQTACKRFLKRGTVLCAAFAAAALFLAPASTAASGKHARTVRDEARAGRKYWILLVSGDWCPAGNSIAEMLASGEFRKAAGSKYVWAVFDDCESPPADRQKKLALERANARAGVPGLKSTRLPAIFAGDPKGDLFYVAENVPFDITPETLLSNISKADALRAAAEKNLLSPAMVTSGPEAAEKCGAFIAAMEPLVGGLDRVKLDCCYKRAWDRLEKLDPKDATGWRRRFAMGNGHDLVNKASLFAKDGKTEEGERFIAAECAKNASHLTTEQKQALEMMKFALYRKDDYKTQSNIEILSRILAMGYDTLWGTAAAGYLEMMGEPPVSIPFGWGAKSMRAGEFDVEISCGVKERFAEAGIYDIIFRQSGGGRLDIESVTLKERGRALVKAVKPHVGSDGETVFSIRFNPQYSDMATAMSVHCKADDAGAGSSVGVEVRRRILRPRGKAAKQATGGERMAAE